MDIYRVIFNVSIPCLLSFLKARFVPLSMEACILLKNGECHEWPAAIIDGVKSDNNDVSPPLPTTRRKQALSIPCESIGDSMHNSKSSRNYS